MEHDMAPPNKRRRLSGSPLQSLPSRSEFIPEGPSPTLLHSVEQLEHKATSKSARTVPQHIQEIHLQIQERSIVNERKAYRRLHPRQATAVESLVTTIDASGNTIVTEITVGATTTTSTSPSGSSVPAASGSSSFNSSSSTNLSVSSGTTTSFSNSHNGTTTHTATNISSTQKSGQATLPSGVYLATLKNGHVVTITRSNKPYETTFANGQISTICDRQGECKVSTHGHTHTRPSPDDSTPISTVPSPVTSTAYVAASPADQGTPTSPSSSTSTAVQHNNTSSNDTPPPGTIAGGVVGGAAGLAVILLLAMILVRWYKRRKRLGHHALATNSVFSPDPDTSSSRGPGMAERAGLRPLVTAVPGFFRHQNRSEIEPPPSERSFQKVSGRKLPSAFSEGMSSADTSGPAYSVPSTAQDRNLSSLSFYRDSQGFYGGEGDAADRSISPDEVPPLQSDTSGVLLSPGPQRRPTVHTGGPYIMSPSSSVPSTPNMQSPNLATIPGSPTEIPRTVARSSTPSTITDNRSSRFTEEV